MMLVTLNQTMRFHLKDPIRVPLSIKIIHMAHNQYLHLIYRTTPKILQQSLKNLNFLSKNYLIQTPKLRCLRKKQYAPYFEEIQNIFHEKEARLVFQK